MKQRVGVPGILHHGRMFGRIGQGVAEHEAVLQGVFSGVFKIGNGHCAKVPRGVPGEGAPVQIVGEGAVGPRHDLGKQVIARREVLVGG